MIIFVSNSKYGVIYNYLKRYGHLWIREMGCGRGRDVFIAGLMANAHSLVIVPLSLVALHLHTKFCKQNYLLLTVNVKTSKEM